MIRYRPNLYNLTIVSSPPRRTPRPPEPESRGPRPSPSAAQPSLPETPAFWPRPWSRRRSAPASGAENMAIDLALLERVADDGVGVLRTYEWSHPTVSFGRNERVRGVWDVDAMEAAGLHVVRRPTGGRALFHDREVTWSVCLPLPDHIGWREAYAAVNVRLCEALRALGIPVVLSTGAPTAAEAATACFAEPAVGELVVDGAKLAGSAVWRSRGGYLQHGSILLHDAQDMLDRFRVATRTPVTLQRADDAHGVPRSAQISDWLGPASDAVLRDRVHEALDATWRTDGTTWQDFAPSALERRVRAEALASLVTTAWLWRR